MKTSEKAALVLSRVRRAGVRVIPSRVGRRPSVVAARRYRSPGDRAEPPRRPLACPPVSGVLPPFGVRKRIQQGRGWTLVGPIPVASFDVRGSTLVYRHLPVRDELERQADGTWLGRGLLWGREFCRFRLVGAR